MAGAPTIERFTVFNIKMNFQFNSDPDHPYWNKKADQNYNFFRADDIFDQSGSPLPARLIALNGDFYDVTDERTNGGGS